MATRRRYTPPTAASEYRHACGHQIPSVRDSAKGRSYAADMATRDCRECVKSAAWTAAEVKAAAGGLPILDGSPKQQEWALVLRDIKLRQFEATMDRISRYSDPELRFVISAVEGLLYGQRSASFWIEQRRTSEDDLLATWTGIARIMAEGATTVTRAPRAERPVFEDAGDA